MPIDYPFISPDPRISLCVYTDSKGLRYWNDKNDPMPIKTRNMAGLQKWEETEDYIIYLDKDAVMTTVQQYVTGDYQKFLERKADIETNMELIKSYNIEWTEEDDSNLFIQCNRESLEKLKNEAMLLPEDTQPIALEPKTVPTTYECCFRTDKKTFEFYIGEGYENLTDRIVVNGTYMAYGVISESKTGSSRGVYHLSFYSNLDSGEVYLLKHNTIGNTGFLEKAGKVLFGLNITSLDTTSMVGEPAKVSFINGRFNDVLYNCENIQITKTDTPRPFVKSIFPNGKLAFVTDATSETHSFVMKGIKFPNNSEWVFPHIMTTKISNIFEYSAFRDKNVLIQGFDSLTSKATDSSCKAFSNGVLLETRAISNRGVTDGVINVTYKSSLDSFKQLLIYKGSLTEEELKAESVKDIRLK